MKSDWSLILYFRIDLLIHTDMYVFCMHKCQLLSNNIPVHEKIT